MEFLFQVTLLASIRVEAGTRAEAELKLRAALEASEANLGTLDDTLIVVPVEIEGELDGHLQIRIFCTSKATGESAGDRGDEFEGIGRRWSEAFCRFPFAGCRRALSA